MKLLRWRDPIGRYYFFRGLLGRVYLPIIVIYMLDRGLSVGQVALISTIAAAASFIFEVPSGAIADHLGHRRALIVSVCGQALAALSYLGGTFPWILVGSVGYMVAGSLMTVTGEALFYEYLKSLKRETEHLKLSGEGKSFSRIFNVVSVALGGLTYTIHPFLPFIICSVQYLLAALVISTFPDPKRRTSVEKTEGFLALLQHFPSAIKNIWREPRLFWLIAVNAMVIGVTFSMADFGQIIFQNLGATTAFIGGVYVLQRLLAILMSSRVHYLAKYLKPAQLMTVVPLIGLSHYLLIPVVGSPVALAIVSLLATVVYVTLEIASNDYMNQLIDGRSRATTLSVNNFTRGFVTIVTSATFGLLSLTITPEYVFALIGIAQIIILIFPLIKLSRAYARAA